METIDELKAAIAKSKEDADNIRKHLHRIEKEYSDWEDRVWQIEMAVAEAEKITGLTKEEIMAPKDPFEGLFE
jgi:predicted  nucleic acid-binding Zn-ribbon protein